MKVSIPNLLRIENLYHTEYVDIFLNSGNLTNFDIFDPHSLPNSQFVPKLCVQLNVQVLCVCTAGLKQDS